MNHTDIIVALIGMIAIAIAAMCIQDAVHQQVALLRYRQYKAIVHQMTVCIERLNAQNDALRAEIKRLRAVDSETEADEILGQVRH